LLIVTRGAQELRSFVPHSAAFVGTTNAVMENEVSVHERVSARPMTVLGDAPGEYVFEP